MTSAAGGPGDSPTFTFIELNWNVITDALLAYLQASASEQDVAGLFQAWQRLVQLAQRIDSRIPAQAHAGVISWARGLGSALRFPVAGVTRQVNRLHTVLSVVLAMQGRPSHG